MGNYRTYSYLVKLQPRFLSLQWKTCLWAELQPWHPNLQWRTCPWAEDSDDDDDDDDDVYILMGLIFNPCGEFLWSLEGAVSRIHSPHLHAGAPGVFSDLLRSVQMLKREWGAEVNRKLPHLSIPRKTAAWVPEFAVEDLHLNRTATLVPEFAAKDLPLGRILWWLWFLVYGFDEFSTIREIFFKRRTEKFWNETLQSLIYLYHSPTVKELSTAMKYLNSRTAFSS